MKTMKTKRMTMRTRRLVKRVERRAVLMRRVTTMRRVTGRLNSRVSVFGWWGGAMKLWIMVPWVIE